LSDKSLNPLVVGLERMLHQYCGALWRLPGGSDGATAMPGGGVLSTSTDGVTHLHTCRCSCGGAPKSWRVAWTTAECLAVVTLSVSVLTASEGWVSPGVGHTVFCGTQGLSQNCQQDRLSLHCQENFLLASETITCSFDKRKLNYPAPHNTNHIPAIIAEWLFYN
jgi:hypothetical protein